MNHFENIIFTLFLLKIWFYHALWPKCESVSRFGEPWGGTAVSQSVSQYEVHKAQIRCFNRNMKLNSMKRVTDAAAAPDFKRLKDTRSVSRRFKHSLMGLTKEDFLQPLKLCGNTFSADFGDWKVWNWRRIRSCCHREAIFLRACVSDYVVMGILETFLLLLLLRSLCCPFEVPKSFFVVCGVGRSGRRLSIRPHKAIRATTAVRILVFGTDKSKLSLRVRMKVILPQKLAIRFICINALAGVIRIH